MSITTISRSFVWENCAAIIPATVIIIPLAIEIGCFFKNLYHDPKIIEKKWGAFKTTIHQAYHRGLNESEEEFHTRYKKNVILSAVALVALAGVSCCPFFILPCAFAIPCALVAVYSVGKLIYTIQQNPKSIQKVQDYLKDAFQQRTDEDINVFHARRWEAIKRIVFCTVIFAAVVGTACIAPYLAIMLTKGSSIWALGVMPFQSKAVVFSEYLFVGFLHAIQAARFLYKGERSRAIFHGMAALSAVFFPFWYLFAPGAEMRLHHSFLGLALQLAPWQAVRTLGTFIVLDSSLYCFAGKRGYQQPQFEMMTEYDYMDAIYENFSTVLLSIVSISFVQKILETCSSRKSKKKTPEIIKV